MKGRPNIITIVTDDQGYGDLSCMGSEDIISPNFDRLAASGARFECLYSNSPVCSPSRAALLTGRYPAYAGVRAILAGRRTTTGLTQAAPTIAAALKKQGYATGLIGKWHLGLTHECRPNQNGFDYFYGFMAGCIDYYSHVFYWGMADGHTNPSHDLWENNEEINEDGKYFTDLISDKAVEYIRQQSKTQKPFYLYLGYNAPHYPMHAPKKYRDRFAHLPWDRQMMAAMISAVDDGIGSIMEELERQGQLENTVIYFQSDNGPSRESRNFMDGREDFYYGGSAGKFKGHKFSLFEGGIRVPGIFSWPAGGVKPGTVITEAVAAMDIFPTLLSIAGGNPAEYQLNGKDILPMILHNEPSPHEMIFWEMDKQTAVRKGNYKLVLNGVLAEEGKCAETVFLSDISTDISESKNLSALLPEITQELRTAAEEWRAALEKDWAAKKERAL